MLQSLGGRERQFRFSPDTSRITIWCLWIMKIIGVRGKNRLGWIKYTPDSSRWTCQRFFLRPHLVVERVSCRSTERSFEELQHRGWGGGWECWNNEKASTELVARSPPRNVPASTCNPMRKKCTRKTRNPFYSTLGWSSVALSLKNGNSALHDRILFGCGPVFNFVSTLFI